MANFLTILKSSDISGTSAIKLDDADIKLVQNSMLGIFDDIKEVCDENHIEYQLGGGSALGAVRHKGFIPWDDDIDVNMCRKSFDEFIPKFKEKFSDKYWIHVLGESEGYDLLMVHIVAKDVRAREILDAERIECGLGIDIFIMENTFDNSILRGIHGVGCMAFRYALSCIRFLKNKDELMQLSEKNETLLKYSKKRIRLGRIFSIIPVKAWTKGAAKWMKLCHNDNSENVVIPAGQYQYFREMYKRKDYCETLEVSFEGRKVNISKDYDSYLKNLYGDYMWIPPKEKRQNHIMMELDREALKKYKIRKIEE